MNVYHEIHSTDYVFGLNTLNLCCVDGVCYKMSVETWWLSGVKTAEGRGFQIYWYSDEKRHPQLCSSV